MTWASVSLSSPIEEKIAWARRCYRKFGAALLEDREIAHGLDRLRGTIAASQKEMARAGVVGICRRCDQEEGGSCCGAGIENRYDACLLLINLLLGVHLPDERYAPDACFLSGPNGCLLQARHTLCINYLCRKVTDQMDPNSLRVLREKEGEEVTALFVLEERLKTVLKKWINESEKASPG